MGNGLTTFRASSHPIAQSIQIEQRFGTAGMSECAILIVDDEPNNFDVIEALLSDQDYRLHYSASGSGAMASLEILQPDLILLDVMMPQMDGIEVCQCIKAMPQWQAVPIIMLTALTSKHDLARCLNVGADDFISKPVNGTELIARVRSMLRIRQQHQQLAAFNTHLEATVEQRTAELHRMVYQDALTQLPSRTALLQQLAKSSGAKSSGAKPSSAKPSSAKPSGVAKSAVAKSAPILLYLDCDDFKLVNASFGYAVSDRLLLAIADRLQQLVNPGDMLARMGEDEFCFLLQSITTSAELDNFLQGILRQFERPFTVVSCEIFITVCIGVALADQGDRPPEALLQDADTAMYQAKLRGKGSYQIFDRQMHQVMFERLTLENNLQRALALQEFELHYQPIVHMQNQQLAGFEALVRWYRHGQAVIAPEEFIPCMEATGLIVPVGLMILEQACRQLHQWHQMGYAELTVSVNLSGRQFGSPTLLADIDRIIARTNINPTKLKLEMTESAVMDNPEMAIELTQTLRSRGIQISIDDFGTGYSSLGYLHRFPVDSLKIDRSFVTQFQAAPRQKYCVVETIVALSQQLGLAVIVEGIETPAQLAWLQTLDCEFGQGYLFAKPLPASEVERRYFTCCD